VHAAVGFAIAVLVNRLFPRTGLWGALAVALVALVVGLYPAATHWRSAGGAAAHVWMWVPFMVLLSLAALDAIPRVLREAAAVDRAGSWFAFRTITLPLAAPLLLAGIVFLAIAGLRPLDVRAFVAAHVLLVLAIAADAFAMRSRR
ncbi:MAG: ABC transporter permease subunit, partial [Tepidisphaeraceae bacterium]